ncbi:hypothetical protein NZD88_11495 [Chryseobacterium antibioticum]|uniref:Uncharacterized protein n=1 Tax=Chryseobacterium pyrolae TaxID=2987481 RepID=A0ABT2IHN1_9FLAO|nr:hypothetical protein [Chryseobacterium pyrolae]MCT2408165.1 hypothetical protein [Chryseobacterium pyrolae]
MKYKEDSTKSDLTSKEMLLDIDGTSSRFYSYKLFKSDSTIIANEKSGQAKMKVADQDGKEITPNFQQLTKIRQESLRKTNNPIELSEAIRYPH